MNAGAARGVEADVPVAPTSNQIARYLQLVETLAGLGRVAKLRELTRCRLAALIVDWEAWTTWQGLASRAPLDAALSLSKELKKYCDAIGVGAQAVLLDENPEAAYHWDPEFKTELARELYAGLSEVILFQQVKLPPEQDIPADRLLATLGDEVVKRDRSDGAIRVGVRYRSPALKQAFDAALGSSSFASGDSINELARLGREQLALREHSHELAARVRRLPLQARLGAWYEWPLSRTTERLDQLVALLQP